MAADGGDGDGVAGVAAAGAGLHAPMLGVESGGLGVVALAGAETSPGLSTVSVSCVPSAMGPDGCATQEPGGLRGEVMPKGIVPAPPTLTPPTKVVWSEPWNWHWKRPFSSAFLEAVWQ